MLTTHQDEVQAYLLKKKSEYEAELEQARLADERQQQQGLRSPPLASGMRSPRLLEQPRQGSVPTNNTKSKDMPPLGLFSVSTPRSPHGSPLRSDFPRR